MGLSEYIKISFFLNKSAGFEAVSALPEGASSPCFFDPLKRLSEVFVDEKE
jgi:hypothetical protein